MHSTTREQWAVSALIQLTGCEDCLAKIATLRYGMATMVFDNQCSHESCHSHDQSWYDSTWNERPKNCWAPVPHSSTYFVETVLGTNPAIDYGVQDVGLGRKVAHIVCTNCQNTMCKVIYTQESKCLCFFHAACKPPSIRPTRNPFCGLDMKRHRTKHWYLLFSPAIISSTSPPAPPALGEAVFIPRACQSAHKP